MTLKVIVWGGSGMVGSAVCKAGVSRGWQITSISKRGIPFKTPSGHAPAWVHQVEWLQGSPFDPTTYSHLLPSTTAVVSTLGILLESSYKQNGTVSPFRLLKGLFDGVTGDRGNPLEPRTTYEKMNRDAGLTIFRELARSSPIPRSTTPTPFVFLSAEDIFRPFIPSRYIETKREAERVIEREASSPSEKGGRTIRPIFVRPSLIYHPHINPPSTLPATLLSASATLQSILPTPLQASSIFPPPTPATPFVSPLSPHDVPRPLPSATTSLASLLTIPPIHADTVAEAICQAIEEGEGEGKRGVMDVWEMRRRVGFVDERRARARARASPGMEV